MDLENVVSQLNTTTNNNNETIVDRIVEIDINKLKEHESNFYEMSSMDTLEEEIKVNGLIEPLLITRDYVILSGHRRYNTCKKLGYEKVKCTFTDVTDPIDQLLLLIGANKQRVKSKEDMIIEINRTKELYKTKKENDPHFKGNINKLVANDLGVSESTIKRATSKGSNGPSIKIPKEIKLQIDLLKSLNKLLDEDSKSNFLEEEFYHLKNVMELKNKLSNNTKKFRKND